MTYSLATEDLSAAMWASRNDPKAGFMTLAYNRMLADDSVRQGSRHKRPSENGDHLYGMALRRAVDRKGNKMYRQCETPKSPTVGPQIYKTKCVRNGRKLMALEFQGVRLVLDLQWIPQGLKELLPANWPQAEGNDFADFLSACLSLAPALQELGVLEVAR